MRNRKVTKYDRRLKHVVVILALLAIGNAIDFAFPSEQNFKKKKGVITDIDIETFNGKTRRTRNIIFTKFTLKLDDGRRKYSITQRDGLDMGLAQLQRLDVVELRVKRWYQSIQYLLVEGNFYLARKDGRIVYDAMSECRRANKVFMFIFGGTALLFFAIYLDVVKNISLENWFQKKILKNKDYLNK